MNDNPDILPHVHLDFRWNDTKGETVTTTQVITEMICQGVAAFFGPEGTCLVESIVAQSRNIPMISYVSTYLLNYLRLFPLKVAFTDETNRPIDISPSIDTSLRI